MATPTRSAPPPPPIRKGQVVALEALHNYKAQRDNELTIEEGDMLFILDQTNADWWLARIDDKEGFVPSSYLSQTITRVPIIDGARRGNLELVQECLNAGVSSNTLDKSGSSALHAAAQAGHIECVQALLDSPGVQLHLQNKLGDTPLHCASYRGHDAVVQLLLLRGADPQIKNKDAADARSLARRQSVKGMFDAALLQLRGEDFRSSKFDALEYGDQDDSD
uniref:Osteoclast-stimulating factor 1 n=1 Tax=Hirondellea gigas TaxID=1518452 RepID=A0A2P2I1U9_9CRUS